ncbi:MAG: hypothetical protein AAF208_09625, partial [Cyanobacteria bacterium P01_A01_bin.45]
MSKEYRNSFVTIYSMCNISKLYLPERLIMLRYLSIILLSFVMVGCDESASNNTDNPLSKSSTETISSGDLGVQITPDYVLKFPAGESLRPPTGA